MKFKLCIAATLLLCMQGRLDAQNSFANITLQQPPLKAGSVCPDTKLMTLNHAVIQLSKINKPLILLDLFNTNCGAIAGHLQKMDVLAKKYAANVAIIAVAKQDKSSIEQFIQSDGLTNLGMPIATGDTVLQHAFPYRMAPEIIWLDSNLTVLSVGYDYDVTPANLEAAVHNRLPLLRQKQDKMDYDAGSFSFLAGNGDSTIPAASIITGYHAELPSIGDAAVTGNYKRLLVINESVINLYRAALRFWEPANRVLIKATAKALFEAAPGEENEGSWYATHLFCYESRLPARSSDSPEKRMLEDLDKAFNVRVALEQVDMPCYILVRTDTLTTWSTAGGKPMTNFTTGNQTRKWMHNLPFSSLLSYLNNIPGMRPCIDETGYSNPVDIVLNNDLADLPALKKALRQYGLDLRPTVQKITMMVIRDN